MVTVDITLLFQMINIIVLMFILNGVLYKPVKKILRDRSEKMQGMQSEVARIQENARLRQEEVDKKWPRHPGRQRPPWILHEPRRLLQGMRNLLR